MDFGFYTRIYVKHGKTHFVIELFLIGAVIFQN